MNADDAQPSTHAGSSPRGYDPRTVLVVVDVQNDFADPEGSLYVEGGEEIIDGVNDEISAALEAGSSVVFTQDWHPPDTPHFAKDGGTWPVHCVRETWGARFHPRLRVPDDAPVVRKGVDGGDGYSGFSVRDPVSGAVSSTELGRLIDEAGGERLVVAGLAGDVCVRATALDARALGYPVRVPLHLTRFVQLQDGDRERAIEAMRDAGVDVT